MAKVATSCACLTTKVQGAADATERVPPGGVPFVLALNPTGIGETGVVGRLYLYFAPDTKKKFTGAVRIVDVSLPEE